MKVLSALGWASTREDHFSGAEFRKKEKDPASARGGGGERASS